MPIVHCNIGLIYIIVSDREYERRGYIFGIIVWNSHCKQVEFLNSHLHKFT